MPAPWARSDAQDIGAQEEMRDLVLHLLAEGGYGFDDHSDHAWSVEEIRNGLPTGETFRAQHPEHVSLSGVQCAAD